MPCIPLDWNYNSGGFFFLGNHLATAGHANTSHSVLVHGFLSLSLLFFRLMKENNKGKTTKRKKKKDGEKLRPFRPCYITWMYYDTTEGGHVQRSGRSTKQRYRFFFLIVLLGLVKSYRVQKVGDLSEI